MCNNFHKTDTHTNTVFFDSKEKHQRNWEKYLNLKNSLSYTTNHGKFYCKDKITMNLDKYGADIGYVNNNNESIGIEFKLGSDLSFSLNNMHLHEQIDKGIQYWDKFVVVASHTQDNDFRTDYGFNNYWGKIVGSTNVQFVPANNMDEAIRTIKDIFYYHSSQGCNIPLHRVKYSCFVSALKCLNLSDTKIKNIRTYYPTLRSLSECSVDDLMKIKGIGEVTANEIVNLVFNT